MSISTDVRDNEAKKFRTTPDGPAVAIVNSGEYFTNDLDESGTTTYIGKSDGLNWLIQRIVESGNDLTIRYATADQNLTTTTYEQAWTNRTMLNYVYK